MPFKDPDKQREYRRRWYNERYSKDAKFRAAEADRKAAWMEDNEERRETMREYRRKKVGRPYGVKVNVGEDEMILFRDEARRRKVQIQTVIRELALERLSEKGIS